MWVRLVGQSSVVSRMGGKNDATKKVSAEALKEIRRTARDISRLEDADTSRATEEELRSVVEAHLRSAEAAAAARDADDGTPVEDAPAADADPPFDFGPRVSARVALALITAAILSIVGITWLTLA